jgi:hypothetical protein
VSRPAADPLLGKVNLMSPWIGRHADRAEQHRLGFVAAHVQTDGVPTRSGPVTTPAVSPADRQAAPPAASAIHRQPAHVRAELRPDPR